MYLFVIFFVFLVGLQTPNDHISYLHKSWENICSRLSNIKNSFFLNFQDSISDFLNLFNAVLSTICFIIKLIALKNHFSNLNHGMVTVTLNLICWANFWKFLLVFVEFLVFSFGVCSKYLGQFSWNWKVWLKNYIKY